ncbi:protein S100-P-like [Stigmatopora argus]
MCDKMNQQPTELEMALFMLCNVFDKYAKEDGRKDTLSRSEAKKLVQKELPQLFQAGMDKPEGVDILKSLDSNQDGELDFCEFITCVASLACVFKEVSLCCKQ